MAVYLEGIDLMMTGTKGRLALFVVAATLLVGCATQNIPLAYDAVEPRDNYPLHNPYAATIVGVPSAMKTNVEHVVLPTERKLVVFPDRKIPEGFWYHDALLYGEMLQKKSAPLVYVIGGTGSGYKSRYTLALAKTLFNAGYHVVLLPSPTHSNFIVTASENFIPGNAETDARDLYRVIQMIEARLDNKIEVTTRGLAGYSLGGWHAAFLSALDGEKKLVGFNRTLIINPPFNLYSSIKQLDGMLLRGLPNGIAGLDEFIDRTLMRLARLQNDSDSFDFPAEDRLYESYLKLHPSDNNMATTIGLAFRLSAANMIFSSDVMARRGYIYPKDKPFLSSTPLNDTMALALRTSLAEYFRDIFVPYYARTEEGLDEASLAQRSSLNRLADYIARTPGIGMLTNQDDIILAPGDLEKLKQLFAGKHHVFAHGGHLGNMEHPAFAWRVLKFFEGEAF